MDMDYIDSSFDYDVENEDFYEVSVPAKGQKRRVTFKQQVSTKVSEGLFWGWVFVVFRLYFNQSWFIIQTLVRFLEKILRIFLARVEAM
ncbi:hypothetical protein Zmor_019503 [Zophobas morio]|uniref:Uncharacterized protein n=1 Tax=Zophobas morio TaxID=2755281 RepID=A0AA38I4M5_9CUCU|nr:hypothetical protein Zmor_019503 [Zophobas morio]